MQTLDLELHILAKFFVQRRQRLVHEQHARMEDDRSGDGDALLLSTGEFTRIAGFETRHLNEFHCLRHAGADFPVGQTALAESKADILAGGHMGEQRVVLEYHTNISPKGRNPGDRPSIEENLASIGRFESRKKHKTRGLSRPARTQKGDEFPLLDRDTEPGYRVNGAEALANIVEQDRGAGLFSLARRAAGISKVGHSRILGGGSCQPKEALTPWRKLPSSWKGWGGEQLSGETVALDGSVRAVRGRRIGRLPRAALVVPLVIYLAVLYAVPVVGMMLRSISDPHWTTANFAQLLSDPVFGLVLWITFRISLVVTVVALLLGYPVAYLLARLPASRANLLLVLVLVPFWSSILVRSYAWMVLLGRDGIVNQFLLWLGVISAPLRLLYTTFAVYVSMVHVLLPFMILPLYAVLRGLDPNLLRAGASLGARPSAVFRQIVLPLSVPGVSAGCLLVFILSLGFYITPALVGGPRDLMMAVLIQQQIDELNWSLGSALAVVLLATALGAFAIFTRVLKVEQTFGRARA